VNFVRWDTVATELRRIGRFSPSYSPGNDWEDLVERLLQELAWDKVLDFCERLYTVMARTPPGVQGGISKGDVQEHIASELQRLFIEENLAFEFVKGVVRRRGRRNTADKIARAETVLGDPRLSSALVQFNKALKYFRNVPDPDYENAVKEAVCAIEATARALFPKAGSTLGDVISSLEGNGEDQIPKALAKTFHGLYGFRSGGQGVGHGGATGGAVTKEIAEYVLATASSQIVFLFDFSAAIEQEPPF
jgi:hypothetical protein